ncbi:MAG: sugar transferase [Acetobacter sp.]|nr:sugar transferase [Bacteroides sp.]MCM1341126.1 sugar transferase [Acetobacter sp.]MCM1433540.1 sugar transferase [Clostridiales bacterium]
MHKIPDYSLQEWSNRTYSLAVSFLVIFLLFASPLDLSKRSKKMEFVSCIRNSVLTFACFGVLLILTKNEIIESRYLFFGVFLIHLVVSLLFRFITKKLLLNNASKSRHATQTGIITITENAETFVEKLKADWTKNIKAVALLDTSFNGSGYIKNTAYTEENGSTFVKTAENVIDNVQGIPVVANKENLLGWIRTASIDEIYINLPSEYSDTVVGIIEELEDMGITVNMTIPSLEKIVNESKFDNINCNVKAGYPMAVFSPAVHNEKHLIIKTILDFIGGILGSIISLPIILLVAIPLKLESPGPLIFKQQRVGKNGRIFNIYKLRSMYVDAEERKAALMEQNQMNGLMFKMEDDPRITKVGKFIRKFSIDELPQFWNVAKGDMSLVGTRPPTIDEFEKYESHHKRRLSFNPGITGIWQVSGRSEITDFEDIVKMDCDYIDNWSLGLDIKILFKTVGVVLTCKGAE